MTVLRERGDRTENAGRDADRRHAPRVHDLQGHCVADARIWPGRDVVVVNLSEGGALVEGDARLVPGMSVDLQLTTTGGRLLVRGRVVRCYVSSLGRQGRVRYRGAVAFEQPLAHAPREALGELVARARG